MSRQTRDYFMIFLKVYVLALLFSPLIQSAFSLSELTDLYQSPQGLGMGNALTTDASGYQSIYYNPAGVANQFKRKWEVNLLDLQGGMGLNTVLEFGKIKASVPTECLESSNKTQEIIIS